MTTTTHQPQQEEEHTMATTNTTTVYGYARISTPQQSIDRQIRNIRAAYPTATIITEAYSGTTLARPAFQRMLRRLHAGDTVVFDSVSRMSRDAQEGTKLYLDLNAKQINLVFIKEPHINTETYRAALAHQVEALPATGDAAADKLLSTITAALNEYMQQLAARQIELAFAQAQKEADDLHQRTREGMETARQAGKQIGQRQGAKLNVKKAVTAKAVILEHSKTFGGTLSDADCIRLAGVSRNTYYLYKRQLLEEAAQEQGA